MRTVGDLSWPSHGSVNLGISPEDSTLKFTTIDNTV